MGRELTQNQDANQRSQNSDRNQPQTSQESRRSLLENDPIKLILFTIEFEKDNVLQDDKMVQMLKNNLCECAQR